MATTAKLAENADVCAACEGSGVNITCTGPCGRSFHDACTSVNLDEVTSKDWRCGRCSDKILLVRANLVYTKALHWA